MCIDEGIVSFSIRLAPPLLHLEKQAACLIDYIMSSMEPDHHIVNIIPSAVVLLILHPPEHLNAMFKRTYLGYLPNKKGEIFPGEAAHPAIQETLYIVPVVELQKPFNHLRNAPILLKPIGFDPQSVVFGNVGFSESRDMGRDLVLAVVVVDEHHLLLLFQSAFALGFLA